MVLAAYAEPDPSMASPQDQHQPPGPPKRAGLQLFLPRAQGFERLRFPRTGGFVRSCSRDARCITRTDRLLTAGITVTSDGVLWLAYVQEQSTTRSDRAFRPPRQMPYDKIDASERHEELRLVRIDPASSPPAVELRWRVPDSGLLQNITRGGLALAFSGSQLHLAAGSRIAGRGAIRYVLIDTGRLPMLPFPAGERPQRVP